MSVDDASLAPERWRRISELLDRVLSLAPEARAAFLRSAEEARRSRSRRSSILMRS